MYDVTEAFAGNPMLGTERLLLRKITRSDTADMFEYSKTEEVCRYLLWSPHPTPDYTRRYIESLASQYRSRRFFDFSVVLKESGKMVGTCGFTTLDNSNKCGEIGYVISGNYRHMGIASEAAMTVMRWGFITLGLNRIEAKYMVENEFSRAVMEKCGMTFEGVQKSKMLVKEKYRDIGICAVLRKDFIAKFGDFPPEITYNDGRLTRIRGFFS